MTPPSAVSRRLPGDDFFSRVEYQLNNQLLRNAIMSLQSEFQDGSPLLEC